MAGPRSIGDGAERSVAAAGAPRGDDPAGDDLLARRSTLGRYVVIQRIGTGGMGVVYAAYDPELDRKVAIKLLRARAEDGHQDRRERRLAREAKAVARLSHPNVVGIFDVGGHDGRVFLAMEHLGGGTLRDWLAAEKRPWRAVLKMFAAAGRGLAAAHGEGLVHRDFKLDNVLLDKSGVPKVVDFGVVRFASAPDPAERTADDPPAVAAAAAAAAVAAAAAAPAPAASSTLDATAPMSLTALTHAGSLTGTPAYMAPEQFLGGTVDARTDQFAFCVSLYEALYGQRPFAAQTVVQLADAVASGRISEAPRDAAVPGWVRRVVLRGLAANPADRHPSVAALLQALSDDPVARRWRRSAIAATVVAVVLVGLGLQRRSERRHLEFERQVAARRAEGDRAFGEARSLAQRAQLLRARSFALFDAHDRDGGERAWVEARAASTSLDATLERAAKAFESALVLDPQRSETRRRAAEVLHERAALAAQELRREDEARHLAALEAVDLSGEQVRRWRQPGALSVRTSPAGARVTIERHEGGARGRPTTATPVGGALASPIARHALPPGSYRLRIEKPGHVETLFPVVLGGGEELEVDLALPEAAEVPAGFAFVPAGRFLFGSADERLRTSFLDTVPIHVARTGSFVIARTETTFGDWIAFLDELPASARPGLIPNGEEPGGGYVRLVRSEPGGWILRLNPWSVDHQAKQGDPVDYRGRAALGRQDWLRMPVTGVGVENVERYLSWLHRTGRVPGARLCDELEWERAARGADNREYPHGGTLGAGDANFDETYGKDVRLFGLDEVGRHPASRSPFGLDDMAGNAFEFVSSALQPGEVVVRGGSYRHNANTARSTNRGLVTRTTRGQAIGFRVCASYPHD